MASISLQELVEDFADGLKGADALAIAHKSFRPGIGPFGEEQAVRAALGQMAQRRPERYLGAAIRRKPDLFIPNEWAIEIKLLRPYGNNDQIAEHWSENVLHPYAGNTSSLGDCIKLLEASFPERKAVLIIGYEHEPSRLPLEPAIRGFELLAELLLGISLSPRHQARRDCLIHPVHQALTVYGYEVLGYLAPTTAVTMKVRP